MNKTIAIIATASIVLLGGTAVVKSLATRRVEVQNGQVKIVQTQVVEQLPVDGTDRLNEALDRVAKVEEWLNRVEEENGKKDERIKVLEKKAGIPVEEPIEAEPLIEASP